MAISDKLNYLIETKDLFKDRLNLLGAEIIESTTFRNYLNWLDNFYIGSANKTDLAKNGVVGRTNQDGEPTPENPVEINNLSGDVEYKVKGKNLFDINNALNNNLYNQGTSLSLITNGIRATTEAVANYRMSLIKIGETNKLIGKTIRVKANFSSNGNNNGRFYIGYCDASGENRVSKSDTTTSGNTLSMVVESGSGENICLVLYSNQSATNYTIGNYVDYKNIIMTIDNEDMTYEPHISESFPLSLKSRNSFDKDNANYINSYIGQSNTLNGSSFKAYYIPCKENTVYTISKVIGNYFRVATTENLPVIGSTVLQKDITHDTSSSITILTTNNSHYLVFNVRNNSDTLTEQEILDSIQIEENSVSTNYEPYYDIELCHISDYKDRIYSQNGEFYLEKKTGKVVLDETMTYYKSATTSVDKYYTRLGYTFDNSIPRSAISNCFVYKPNGVAVGQFDYSQNNQWLALFFCYAEYNTSTINDFKNYVKSNETYCIITLPTPTTTEITQENYPTLYSQLLAIQEFLTKYKINKEFLLDYSSPEIKY